jgi:DNA ligase-1
MSNDFKPMLAGKAPADLSTLSYPRVLSPKLDGIRAVILGGVVYSRNLKPIPNKHIQRMFGNRKYNGLDGELIVGDPTHKDCYRNTMSVVMADAATHDEIRFFVFDDFSKPLLSYIQRRKLAQTKLYHISHMPLLQQRMANNAEDVVEYEEFCLLAGYEGAMIRSTTGQYRFGRATVRTAELLKLKRFEDSEARIVDSEAKEHNGNEQQRDELGRSKRSSHKAGKVTLNTLGTLRVVDVHTGEAFGLGTGFSDAQRAELWSRRATLPGLIVKYKYFPMGNKAAPRFPVFLGFRDVIDC